MQFEFEALSSDCVFSGFWVLFSRHGTTNSIGENKILFGSNVFILVAEHNKEFLIASQTVF